MTPKTASGLWIANCVDCVEREFLYVGRIYSANLYHFPEFTGFLPACQHETEINFICVQYKLRAFHIRQPEFQSSTVPELQNPTSPELPKFPSISGTRPQIIKVTSAGPPDTYNKYNPRRKKNNTLEIDVKCCVFFFYFSSDATCCWSVRQTSVLNYTKLKIGWFICGEHAEVFRWWIYGSQASGSQVVVYIMTGY